MDFTDKTIVCVDCQAEFIHSAEDQRRYAERGFTNEPKRCRTCRDQRKASGGGGRSRGGEGGGGGGGGARGGFGGESRAPKQLHPAVCADCGKETEVPFKPTGARPVYCRDCYRKQRG